MLEPPKKDGRCCQFPIILRCESAGLTDEAKSAGLAKIAKGTLKGKASAAQSDLVPHFRLPWYLSPCFLAVGECAKSESYWTDLEMYLGHLVCVS
jgi:hypothetical protein